MSRTKQTDPITIKCQNCGKEHQSTTCNCCWVYCDCDKQICGRCGSTNLQDMKMSPEDDEAQYWCCTECGDCGLTIP